MRVEIEESVTRVVVENSQYTVQPVSEAPLLVVEETEVTVEVPAPEITVVQAQSDETRVIPEIMDVRIISIAEQGPPGAMTYRVFDAVWTADLLISWSDYDLFRVELGGPTTDLTFDGAVDGQRVILELQQDGTGNRTVNFLSTIRYGSLIPSITLSTAPAATDRLGFMYNEATDTYDLMALARGF